MRWAQPPTAPLGLRGWPVSRPTPQSDLAPRLADLEATRANLEVVGQTRHKTGLLWCGCSIEPSTLRNRARKSRQKLHRAQALDPIAFLGLMLSSQDRVSLRDAVSAAETPHAHARTCIARRRRLGGNGMAIGCVVRGWKSATELLHCSFGGLLAFLAHIETVIRVRVFASRCDNERSVNYPKGEERRD